MALLASLPLIQADTLDDYLSPQVTLQTLPGDSAGDTRVVLGQMAKWTREYKLDQTVIANARNIISRVGEKNYWAEAEAIQQYVRDAIRYTRDVFDVETLQTPVETLRTGHGDCDDKALLAGALLQAVGHGPIRYVAYAFAAPDAFEHVNVEFRYGVHWVSVETTEDVPLGWRPPQKYWTYIANVPGSGIGGF